MKMINRTKHLEMENQKLRTTRKHYVKGAAAAGVATGVLLTTLLSKAISKFPTEKVKSKVNEKIELLKEKFPRKDEEYDLLVERDDYDYIETHAEPKDETKE